MEKIYDATNQKELLYFPTLCPLQNSRSDCTFSPPAFPDVSYQQECLCADKCKHCSVEFQLDIECQEDSGLTVTHLDIVGTDSDRKIGIEREDWYGSGNFCKEYESKKLEK